MSLLYLYIDLFSLAGPLLLSFDKKVHFYTYWKAFFVSVFIMMVIFLTNDMYFTFLGHWGFNVQYLSGITIYNLPVEECLFFIVIPYACVFTYECVCAYFSLNYNYVWLWRTWLIIALVLLTCSFVFYSLAYTFFAFFGASFLIFLVLYQNNERFLRYFTVSFLLILLPFLLVNGILTGTAIQDEVVWYNELAITRIRIGTIPIEDVVYCLFMLLAVFIPYEQLKLRWNK